MQELFNSREMIPVRGSWKYEMRVFIVKFILYILTILGEVYHISGPAEARHREKKIRRPREWSALVAQPEGGGVGREREPNV